MNLLVILAMLLAGVAPPPAPPPVEAFTKASSDLQIGFTIAGRVAEVLVKPGQGVHAGDPLLRLDDAEERAQLELLQLRAESTLEISAAKAEWDLAVKKEQLLVTAVEKGGATTIELEVAHLESERARLAHDLFVQHRVEAQLQLKQALEHARQSVLLAPISGVVDSVVAELGEPVEPLRPILRLVDTAALRIDAQFPIARTLLLEVGDTANVRYKIGDMRTEVRGRIVHLASVADAASDTRLVRIELQNKEHLPAGCLVEVDIVSEHRH